jgi:hypothetical protein
MLTLEGMAKFRKAYCKQSRIKNFVKLLILFDVKNRIDEIPRVKAYLRD